MIFSTFLKGKQPSSPGDAAFLRLDIYQYNIRADPTDTPPGDQVILPGRADPKHATPSRHDHCGDVAAGQFDPGVGDKAQPPTIPDADHFFAIKLRKFTHNISPQQRICAPECVYASPSLSSCSLYINNALSVSILLKGRQLPSCKHHNNQLSACWQKRHSAPGEVSEGWLALREQGAQRPSEPLLWVLSVRPQKVPPPAGTGKSN